ncbi:MAG TPA: undecaprenyl-phosphate glucose phosphotransferase [Puia sp.]|nr:undecaprenyl-phosphate glucose phosphotransferase [Puia sp.]
MNKPFLQLISVGVLLLDLTMLNSSMALCELFFHAINERSGMAYWIFWIGLNISWIIVTWIVNVYDTKNILHFEAFARRTMHAWCYWLILVMLYLFFARQFLLSRLFIAASMIGYGVLLMLNRFILLYARSFWKYHSHMSRKVMIIGYNSMAKKLASYLEEEEMDTEIVGFCEEAENVHELSNYPIIDSVNNSIRASRQHQVNEIYSTIAPEQHKGIYGLMLEADNACIHFRLIPDLSHFVKRNYYINYLKDIPVLSLRQEPLSETTNRIRKRFFDIVVSLLVTILILSWLIPILALLISVESRGPIFFKQKRTGRDRKVFYCLKFRSMKLNKDADLKQAARNDTRLTRLGKFLRRSNLDEFPQFLNVLKGDMSVVGPRPHMLKHTDDYSNMIDKYMVRQFLKPGITGWAQINGHRGEIRTLQQLQERVEHDIWYMENWNQWLDVRIIFMTLANMISGQKNAF